MTLVDFLIQPGNKGGASVAPANGGEAAANGAAEGFRDALAATLNESGSQPATAANQAAGISEEQKEDPSAQDESNSEKTDSSTSFFVTGLVPVSLTIPQASPVSVPDAAASENSIATDAGIADSNAAAEVPAVVSQQKPPALPPALVPTSDATGVGFSRNVKSSADLNTNVAENSETANRSLSSSRSDAFEIVIPEESTTGAEVVQAPAASENAVSSAQNDAFADHPAAVTVPTIEVPEQTPASLPNGATETKGQPKTTNFSTSLDSAALSVEATVPEQPESPVLPPATADAAAPLNSRLEAGVVPTAALHAPALNQNPEGRLAEKKEEAVSIEGSIANLPSSELPETTAATMGGSAALESTAFDSQLEILSSAQADDSETDDNPAHGDELPAMQVSSGNPTKEAHQSQSHHRSDVVPDEVTSRVVADVAQGVHSAIRGGHEIHIRLNPDELGGIRIDIAMRDGQLTARLEAERPASERLLSDNLHELREQLSQQGVQVDRIEVVRAGENSSAGWSPNSSNSSLKQQDRQQFPSSQSGGQQRDSGSDVEGDTANAAQQPVIARTSRGKIKQLDIFV